MAIHKDDVGVKFFMALQVASGGIVNISTATTKEFRFLKPDGVTTVDKAASFTTDGSDGRLEYDSEAGLLDVEGLWKVQAHVILEAGDDFRTDVHEFAVRGNL